MSNPELSRSLSSSTESVGSPSAVDDRARLGEPGRDPRAAAERERPRALLAPRRAPWRASERAGSEPALGRTPGGASKNRSSGRSSSLRVSGRQHLVRGVGEDDEADPALRLGQRAEHPLRALGLQLVDARGEVEHDHTTAARCEVARRQRLQVTRQRGAPRRAARPRGPPERAARTASGGARARARPPPMSGAAAPRRAGASSCRRPLRSPRSRAVRSPSTSSPVATRDDHASSRASSASPFLDRSAVSSRASRSSVRRRSVGGRAVRASRRATRSSARSSGVRVSMRSSTPPRTRCARAAAPARAPRRRGRARSRSALPPGPTGPDAHRHVGQRRLVRAPAKPLEFGPRDARGDLHRRPVEEVPARAGALHEAVADETRARTARRPAPRPRRSPPGGSAAGSGRRRARCRPRPCARPSARRRARRARSRSRPGPSRA